MWAKIIQEVDDDGNGELDFYEFSYMMNRLLEDPQAASLYKKESSKRNIYS